MLRPAMATRLVQFRKLFNISASTLWRDQPSQTESPVQAARDVRQAYFLPRPRLPRRKRHSEGGFFLLISDAAFCWSPVRAQQLGPRAQSASDGGHKICDWYFVTKQFPSPRAMLRPYH